MSLTILIAGTPVTILNTSLQIQDALDTRSTCNFTVYDSTGTQYFQFGQQVSVTDSVQGLLFSGYVFDAKRSTLIPNVDTYTAITCIDQHYLADKRAYTGSEFINQYAGANAVSLLKQVLSQEGVTAGYAQRKDATQADFATGTLTGVVDATNVGIGDLELAPAGTTVTVIETTTADFNANASISGLDTTGDQLQLASHGGLQFVGTCGQKNTFGNAYVYQKIWHGTYTIKAGDALFYTVWVNSSSPQIMAGVDLICTDGTTLRDSTSTDLYGLGAHPSVDLSGYANDQWYVRSPSLTPLTGKTVSWAQLGLEGDNAGTYTTYFYDIFIQNQAGVKQVTIYSSGFGQTHGVITQPMDNARVSTNGYTAISLIPVIVYEQTGTRIANGSALAAAVLARNSLISWTQSVPTNMSISVSTSIDGGATYQSVNNFVAIPNLLYGASLTGRTLNTSIILANASKDPTATPILFDITWSIQSGYAATKSDALVSYTKTADWTQTGTVLTNITASNGNLYITSAQRNWDNADISNQTLFGDGHPAQNPDLRYFQLYTDPASQVVSRLDFAGSWKNFTATVDVQVPPANDFIGFEYRTTGWLNANDTYAYMMDIRTTDIYLRVGTNGVTPGSQNTVGHSTLALNVGDWHTLTVTVQGTTHQCFIDGILVITVTDSTYTAAGMIGLRYHQINTAGRAGSLFDNFGVMATAGIVPNTPAPSWLSQIITLAANTVDRSIIFWQAVTDATTQLLVYANYNGGGFQLCTNGGTIPGLGQGVVIPANATLQFKITLQEDRASYGPYVKGLTAWISSAYSSTGTRVSLPLALTPVGRVGNSLVAWNALLPTNTTLGVATSPNGLPPWTDVSGNNGGTIPGYTVQPLPSIDTFSTNTSANYTQTFGIGGNTATWTWDTANARLVVVGGASAQLLTNGITVADVDLLCDMDMSDAGGLVWRRVDASNYYTLVIRDSQALSGTPNTLTLNKVSGGTLTTLGTPSVVAFNLNARGQRTYHRIRVSMLGGVITVSFDGAVVQTYTDATPLAAGSVGMRNASNTSRYSQLRIQPQGDDLTGKNVSTKLTLMSTDPTVTPQVLDHTVAAYSPNIGTGALIPSTQYSVLASGSQNTVAADLDDLAKQSSNYSWRIKSDKSFVFQQRTSPPALFPLATVNGDFLANSNLAITNTSPMYRNGEWIVGGASTISAVNAFLGDGITQTFNLTYPVATPTSGVVNAPVITVNGVAQSVGIKGTNTGMQWYYAAGSNVITHDGSLTPLNTTQTLTVSYQGATTAVSHATNATEQAAYALIEGASGIVEVTESFSGLGSAATDALATARIAQYGVRGQTFTLDTRHSGLAVGQIIPVFCPEHGLTNAQLLLSKLSTTAQIEGTGTVLVYNCELISGYIESDWTRMLSPNAGGKTH